MGFTKRENMKTKRFYPEDKKAIERVLDMGCHIVNEYGEILKSSLCGEYEIENRMNDTKEYKTLSSALTQFLKPE